MWGHQEDHDAEERVKRPAHDGDDGASAASGCDQIEPLLQAAYEETLDAATLGAVMGHIATCPRCGPRFEQHLREGYALARRAPALEPPLAIQRRLYARISTSNNAPQRLIQTTTQKIRKVMRPMHNRQEPVSSTELAPAPPARPTRRLGVWIGAVAALLVVGLLGTVLFSLARVRDARPGAQPAGCAATAITTTPLVGVFLTDLAMASDTAGWAVGVNTGSGNAGTIFHYQQCHWEALPETYPNTLLESVSLASPTDGWAVGGSPTGESQLALHYSAGHWTRVTLPVPAGFKGVFTQVHMLDANEGWILARRNKDTQSQAHSLLLHDHNRVWAPLDAPITDIAGIAPVGPNDLWIAGTTGAAGHERTVFAHYQSGQWTTALTPAGAKIAELRALSPVDIWAEGYLTSNGSGATPAIYHYDGSSWSQSPLSGDRTDQVVEMLSATDGWAFVSTHDRSSPQHIMGAEHYTNGTWQSVAWPYDDIESVGALTRVTDGSFWAIGAYMIAKTKPNDANAGYGGSLFLHYVDGKWSQYGHV
jgi:hypothetical protein